MDAHDFALALIGSLADLREALWSLVAAVSATPVAILIHALIVRKRRKS